MSITAANLIARISVDGAESAGAKLLGVGSAAEETNTKISRLALGGAVIAGAAFIGLGAVAVKMAADFQQGLTLLVTSAGESEKNLSQVGAGILKMSVDTATGADKLETAMFTVESAGYHGAAGLKVLQAAAEGAKIENADLAQVTDALTTTMHDWREPANQAIDVMNSFREAASIGKMRMDDFTGAMKNVGPVASLAKIPLTDVEAALSTMSLEGDKGASAGTHLAQSLLNMIAPSTKAKGVLQEIGLTAQQVSDGMQKSLPDTLKMITDAIGKKFPEGSQKYNEAMSAMFGGTRGLKAILELTGANLKDFTNDANDLAPIMKDNATNVEGWALVQQNFNFQLDAAKNAVSALFIQVGTALLPALTQLLQTVTPLITAFTNWATSGHALNDVISYFNQNTQTLVPILSGLAAVLLAALIPATVTLAGSVIAATWPFLALGVAVGGLVALLLHFHPEITTISGAFQTMWPIIQNTGIALAVFFTPALIKAGIEAVVSAAKITYNFVASLILTGAEGWAAAGKLAVFIAQMIVTGAQAVFNAAKVTFSFVASLIASGVQAYVAAYAISGSFVVALGMVGTQAVAAGGKLTVNLVQGLVAARTASLAATPAIAGVGTAATVAAGPIIALGAIAAATFLLIANKAYIMDKSVKTDTGEMVSAQQLRFHQMATGANISATEMKNNVSDAANTMKTNVSDDANQTYRNVIAHLTDMKKQGLDQVTTLTWQAEQMFSDMGTQVGIDMSTMDTDAKNYWNDIADYINNHPITGSVNYTQGSGAPLMHNAEGTNFSPGGLSWVGERGPEIMYIPKGAQIIPNNKIGSASPGMASGQPVQININIAGHRVAQALLPDITSEIRRATGVRF